jgi:hypothetical protein
MNQLALNRILFLILIAIYSVPLTGCVAIYSSYRGQVIDAETKQPIEDAVVAAGYYKEYPMFPEAQTSVINVRETVTDKDGLFVIPSYITIIAPFSWQLLTDFRIIKPHYQVHNGGPLVVHTGTSYLGIAATSDGNFLMYAGKGCKERGYYYLPMEDAKIKMKSRDVPLDCPKEVETMSHGSPTYLGDEGNFTIVELAKLKTKEERRKNLSEFWLWDGVSPRKMQKLSDALKFEQHEIGL